jgi:predicted extracellular nuclease
LYLLSIEALVKISLRSFRTLSAFSLFLLGTLSAFSQTGLVISQIYTAGGNTGALYNAKFVEIYNPTSSPVTMANWTIQYSSATGTSWSVQATLNGTLPPGQYFLVQGTPGSNGSALPVAGDVTSALAPAAAAGKLLLANTSTAQTGRRRPHRLRGHRKLC